MRSRLLLVAAVTAFVAVAPRIAAAQRYVPCCTERGPTRDRLDAIERQRERSAELRQRAAERTAQRNAERAAERTRRAAELRDAARERSDRMRERAVDRAAERRLSRPSRVYRNRW
jgi:hypothetical protein